MTISLVAIWFGSVSGIVLGSTPILPVFSTLPFRLVKWSRPRSKSRSERLPAAACKPVTLIFESAPKNTPAGFTM